MLAFIGNLGPLEIVVILVLAVLIFGKDLPQAASKAYMQARKLRNAVDDLRRDSGIERELREIERNVREAEWEARRMEAKGALPRAAPEAKPTPAPGATPPVAVTPPTPAASPEPAPETLTPESNEPPPAPPTSPAA
jgi:Sec-independent protein translocase protein TatA